MAFDLFENIPQELKDFDSWVLWVYEEVGKDKPTKVPYSINGSRASVSDTSTWATFDQVCDIARKYPDHCSGIGFVLSEADPFALIDLDDAKDDADIVSRQTGIFNHFSSYSELSPSGSGLHIIAKGSIPSGRRRSSIEIYSSRRFMTMTGNVFAPKPIADYNKSLNELWHAMARPYRHINVDAFYAGLDEAKETDEIIWQRAAQAKNGRTFEDLWEGNWQYLYKSQSEADFALIDIIAFYTQNREQVKRMFLASALGLRDKAKRPDYLSWMLNRCFDRLMPPIDIEGLQIKLNEEIERKAYEAAANSKAEIIDNIDASHLIASNEPWFYPDGDVYTLPPGLVGGIASYIYQKSKRPVKEIALVGALGLMSGICGRAYNVSNTGLNQYLLLLARTGTGKDSMAESIDNILHEVSKTVPYANEFIGPSRIASSQAAIKHLAKKKSIVSIIGEFGLYFSNFSGHIQTANSGNLKEFLLDIYTKSGENRRYNGIAYSDSEKNTNTIQSPAFSLLAESTAETFFNSMSDLLVVDGTLSRFMVVEYEGLIPTFNYNTSEVKLPGSLIEGIADLCATAKALNESDRAIHVSGIDEVYFKQLTSWCDWKANTGESTAARDLWTRVALKTLKLAAIVAVGVNPYAPTITEEIFRWAAGITIKNTERVVLRFESGNYGNKENAETLQIETIRKAIASYNNDPWLKVKTYCNHKDGILHASRVIPQNYFLRRCLNYPIFRNDRIGASSAIKRALQHFVDSGDMIQLSRADMMKTFNSRAAAFMITSIEQFELKKN